MFETELKQIAKIFEEHANPTDAPVMRQYMKNKFDFYGIRQPIRRKLWNDFARQHQLARQDNWQQLIWLLWNLPQREYQYSAIDLLKKCRKQLVEEDIYFLETLAITKSWWDSVDSLNSAAISYYFKQFPHQSIPISQRWIDSKNIWLQRLAIIFQLFHKTKTDVSLLFNNILYLVYSKEFFIQKGIGWALREYSKYDAARVCTFIETHEDVLANLSKREALRWLKQKGKL